MAKLLVNTPQGRQEIIEIGEGGDYFSKTRIIWDDRIDGPMPDITLGGMVRERNKLLLDSDLLASVPALDVEPRRINLDQDLTRAEKVKQINQMVTDGTLTSVRAAKIKGV